MSERGKQYLIRLVRRAGLLPLAEQVRYKIATLKTSGSNQRFSREHRDVVLPPMQLMHDPYRSLNYEWYWQTGQGIAKALADIIQSHCQGHGSLNVLEWGCGPARIIRHLSRFQPAGGFSLFGTDYNTDTINWCRSNLPGIDFRTNGLSPPLDYSNGFFDFVYCVSVFTHLSEKMHYAWLAELLRVTRPGGFILMTLHGNNYRQKLLPDELIRFDAGEIVVRDGFVDGGRAFAAFQSERFMREKFLTGVEIVQHDSREDNPIAPPHDVWIVRKHA